MLRTLSPLIAISPHYLDISFKVKVYHLVRLILNANPLLHDRKTAKRCSESFLSYCKIKVYDLSTPGIKAQTSITWSS
jgi:hypothetical protein